MIGILGSKTLEFHPPVSLLSSIKQQTTLPRLHGTTIFSSELERASYDTVQGIQDDGLCADDHSQAGPNCMCSGGRGDALGLLAKIFLWGDSSQIVSTDRYSTWRVKKIVISILVAKCVSKVCISFHPTT
jgi:hypothetical protein